MSILANKQNHIFSGFFLLAKNKLAKIVERKVSVQIAKSSQTLSVEIR